tara:strand:- start:218 stop:1474 length:1257 start_codon:yes stop_codon:yes gene_type:complete
MLKKGYKPNKEPTLSIGMILPTDLRKLLTITIPKEKKKISIEAKSEHLEYENFKKKEIILKGSHSEDFFIIHSVPAGRGFHWEKTIDVKVAGNIHIKNSDGNIFVVNEIKLEQYLASVATSEMGSACPPALLEAQTIVARSWIIAASEQKHSKLGIDACNDDCCQRYQGITNITAKSKQASKKTIGHFLIFDDRICDTRYSKSCGGISENNENVWDESPKPYLRAVFDSPSEVIPDLSNNQELQTWIKDPPSCYCGNEYIDEKELKKYIGKVDKKGTYFRWTVSYTQKELTKIVNQKCDTSFDLIRSLKPLKRGISGRITNLEISGLENKKSRILQLDSEYKIRDALHPEFLYSSAFIIILNLDDSQIVKSLTLKGAGWGHGVGLCQIGALGMALSQKTSAEILSHYFPSTKIKKMYD